MMVWLPFGTQQYYAAAHSPSSSTRLPNLWLLSSELLIAVNTLKPGVCGRLSGSISKLVQNNIALPFVGLYNDWRLWQLYSRHGPSGLQQLRSDRQIQVQTVKPTVISGRVQAFRQ